MRNPQTLLLILFISLAAFTARSVLNRQDRLFENSKDLPRILHLIDTAYVDDVDLGALMPGAYQSALESLDPNAVYIAPGEVAENKAGEAYARTGLVLTKDNSYAQAVAVSPRSPAYEAGIRPGHYLRRIGGQSTREQNLHKIFRLLTETEGDIKVVGVDPETGDDVERILRLGRFEPQKLSHVAYLDGLHLITLSTFYQGIEKDLDLALSESDPDSRLILDLRNNARGDDSALLLLASRFLPEGQIASWNAIQDERVVISNAQSGPYHGRKLYILIDQSTSRGAEIFAAAARQLDSATLVGEKTRGHTGRYRFLPLQSGGHLYIATSHMMLNDGRYIHKQGVRPDMEIRWDDEDSSEENDLFLDKALEAIRSHKAG